MVTLKLRGGMGARDPTVLPSDSSWLSWLACHPDITSTHFPPKTSLLPQDEGSVGLALPQASGQDQKGVGGACAQGDNSSITLILRSPGALPFPRHLSPLAPSYPRLLL